MAELRSVLHPIEILPTWNDMDTWEKTYIRIWVAQFTSILGFAFALPFAPFYIQELGVTDPAEVKIWVSLFAAATPLGLAIFSPLWGAAADRFGHRLMMLRANFSAVGVLMLMGMVRSVEALIALRLLQGALTGTLTAAQIMVAANAPPERTGRALGSLTAAVFSGAMFGASLGGFFSEWLGYRAVFFIAAGLLFVASCLILFGTSESAAERVHGQPETAPEEGSGGSVRAFWTAFPILLLIVGVSYARQFDMAMMPLLVQEIHGTLEGVSIRTGALLAVGSIAGMLSGFVLGRLADHMNPARLSVVSAVIASLSMVPQALATAVWVLFPARFVMMFCSGGLEAITQAWLSKTTDRQHKGIIFGWASTARALGWVIAPLSSGTVGALLGIRPVYLVSTVLFLLTVPLIGLTTARVSRNRAPKLED